MRVSELMTKQPVCAMASDSAQDVARQMAENDCGLVPVVDDREQLHVIGVVTDRDIAVRGVARGKTPDTRIGDLMTGEVVCVDENAAVDEVEQLMSDRQIRRVVVANADGCCVGIVSQADLARASAAAREIEPSELADVVEQISQPRAVSLKSRAPGSEPGRDERLGQLY